MEPKKPLKAYRDDAHFKMSFYDHQVNWKEGADVRAEHARLLRKKDRRDRIAAHANMFRSHYFAPKGVLNPNELSTDDFYWKTREVAREKQGQNILVEPKSFKDVHGFEAGEKVKIERPFSGSVMSDEEDELKDVKLDNTNTSLKRGMTTGGMNTMTSTGVTFASSTRTGGFANTRASTGGSLSRMNVNKRTSTRERGRGRARSSGSPTRTGTHTKVPTISEEEQDLRESFFNSQLQDGGKAERERLRMKREKKRHQEEQQRHRPGTGSRADTATSDRSRSRGGSRSRSKGRKGRQEEDPETLDPFAHLWDPSDPYDESSLQSFWHMEGQTGHSESITKPFQPMDKDMHQYELRYGGERDFFTEEPVEITIHDPPSYIHVDRRVAGGQLDNDKMNTDVLRLSRKFEGKVRLSKKTMDERKIWIIDEAAETVQKKIDKMKHPAARPKRASGNNDDPDDEGEEQERERFDGDASVLSEATPHVNVNERPPLSYQTFQTVVLNLAKDPEFYLKNLNKPQAVFQNSTKQLVKAKSRGQKEMDNSRRMSVTSSMFALDRSMKTLKHVDTVRNTSKERDSDVRRMSTSLRKMSIIGLRSMPGMGDLGRCAKSTGNLGSLLSTEEGGLGGSNPGLLRTATSGTLTALKEVSVEGGDDEDGTVASPSVQTGGDASIATMDTDGSADDNTNTGNTTIDNNDNKEEKEKEGELRFGQHGLYRLETYSDLGQQLRGEEDAEDYGGMLSQVNLIDRSSMQSHELLEGVELLPVIYYRIHQDKQGRLRPKSAPSVAGRKKQQYNNYYFETLMMQAEKPYHRPRVAIDPPEALLSTVGMNNIRNMAGPLHFGYDNKGNLMTITSQSHQRILRPRSATRVPESIRELEVFACDTVDQNKERPFGKLALKNSLKEFSTIMTTEMERREAEALKEAGGGSGRITRLSSRRFSRVPLSFRKGSSSPGSLRFDSPTSRPVRPDSPGSSIGGSPTSPSRKQLLSSPQTVGSPVDASNGGNGDKDGTSITVQSKSPPIGKDSLSDANVEDYFDDIQRVEFEDDEKDDNEGIPIDTDLHSLGSMETSTLVSSIDYTDQKRTRVRIPIIGSVTIIPEPFMDVSKRTGVKMFNDEDGQKVSWLDEKKERTVLTEVYRLLKGDEWHNNANWCSEKPLREWHGVTVDVRGHVVELNLSKNNLKGEFPQDLGRLSELEVLILDHNELWGLINEPAFNGLEQLEVLSLRYNRFSGEIPMRVFTLLENLREIWLSDNKLVGEIHSNIGNIKKLTHFCVYKNQLEGIIPPAVGRCEKLEVFSCGHNKITGTIPDEMKGCHRLTYLSLYHNKLHGKVPQWIQDLEGLLELNLNFNRFNGYVPKSAKEMYEKKARRGERAARTATRHYAQSRELSRHYEVEDAKRKEQFNQTLRLTKMRRETKELRRTMSRGGTASSKPGSPMSFGGSGYTSRMGSPDSRIHTSNTFPHTPGTPGGHGEGYRGYGSMPGTPLDPLAGAMGALDPLAGAMGVYEAGLSPISLHGFNTRPTSPEKGNDDGGNHNGTEYGSPATVYESQSPTIGSPARDPPTGTDEHSLAAQPQGYSAGPDWPVPYAGYAGSPLPGSQPHTPWTFPEKQTYDIPPDQLGLPPSHPLYSSYAGEKEKEGGHKKAAIDTPFGLEVIGVVGSRPTTTRGEMVNTAQSTDEGYAYIRAVSAMQRGLGIEVEEEEEEPNYNLESWRTGSSSRRLSVFLNSVVDKREVVVSNLPPPDRDDEAALPPHLNANLKKARRPPPVVKRNVLAPADPKALEAARLQKLQAELDLLAEKKVGKEDSILSKFAQIGTMTLGTGTTLHGGTPAVMNTNEDIYISTGTITEAVEKSSPTPTEPRGSRRAGKGDPELPVFKQRREGESLWAGTKFDDTDNISIDSQDTLDTQLLLAANRKQNTDVVEKMRYDYHFRS